MINIIEKYLRYLFKYKPLRSAIATVAYIFFLILILSGVAYIFNLEIFLRDSIIDIAKNMRIVVREKNNLLLYIGYPDGIGLKDDNYEVSWQDNIQFSKMYFTIENPSKYAEFKITKIFITFLNDDKKVDGKDGGNGGWEKFKDNNFNYSNVFKITKNTQTPTNSLLLRFPEKGKYQFEYTVHTEGYEPKSGFKTIIVK